MPLAFSSSVDAPTSRLAARLRHLPRDVLADMAGEMAAAPEQSNQIANERLIKYDLLSNVLSSPDLLPHLLEWLDLEGGTAASAVCKLWRQNWLKIGGRHSKWVSAVAELQEPQVGLVLRLDTRDIDVVTDAFKSISIHSFDDDSLSALDGIEFVVVPCAYDASFQLSHRTGRSPCTRAFCLCQEWYLDADLPFLCLKWRNATGVCCLIDEAASASAAISLAE